MTAHPPAHRRARLGRVISSFSLSALAVPLWLASAPAAHALTQAPTGPAGMVALTWAPTYMSNDHDYTQAEAVALAQRANLVAGMPSAFKKHMAAMRTANPSLQFLAYANSTLAGSGQVSGLPETAFAHSTTGARIKTPSFGTYLMEATSPDWRARTASICTARAQDAGFQGCLFDMLGMGIFSKNYVTALPVKPGTGRLYSELEYRDSMINLAANLRNTLPSYILVGNGMGNYWRYWRDDVSTRPIARSQPAAQAEDFLRGSADAPTRFPDPVQWQGYVDMIRDMEANGSVGLYSTKVWSSATNAQMAQWNKFSMATFLMGAGGKSYYAFVRSRTQAGSSGANAPFQLPKNIGVPTNAMVKNGDGVATRAFTNGVVVVNPTTTGRWIKLSSPMKQLDGTVVSGFNIGPNSGEVLVGSGGLANPGATVMHGSTAKLPVTGGTATDGRTATAVSGTTTSGTTASGTTAGSEGSTGSAPDNGATVIAERRKVVVRLEAESKMLAGGYVSSGLGAGQRF